MGSVLALPPWMAFMSRACPSTKGISCSVQRSASQYQANMHSQATASPSRKGAMAWRNAWGLAGMVLARTDLPVASRMCKDRVLACRSTPQENRCCWLENLLMVSAEWSAWLLVTPVYPLRRGHDEYPGAAADRPRD